MADVVDGGPRGLDRVAVTEVKSRAEERMLVLDATVKEAHRRRVFGRFEHPAGETSHPI